MCEIVWLLQINNVSDAAAALARSRWECNLHFERKKQSDRENHQCHARVIMRAYAHCCVTGNMWLMTWHAHVAA